MHKKCYESNDYRLKKGKGKEKKEKGATSRHRTRVETGEVNRGSKQKIRFMVHRNNKE